MRLSSAFTVVMTSTSFTSFIVLSQDEPMETCTLCENGSMAYAQQKEIPNSENFTCQMLDSLGVLVGGDLCDSIHLHASWCECPGAEPGCPFCDVGMEPVLSETLLTVNTTCGLFNYLAHISDPNVTSCEAFEPIVDFCGGCTAVPPTPAAPMEANPCDKLCADGSDVPFPNNGIFGGDDFTCGQLDVILSFMNPFDSCSIAHYIGVSECGCPDTLPPIPEDASCYVCQDQSVPTKLSFEILPDLTCRGLGFALLTENETCTAIQATAGSYCGCNNNSDNACRICGGDNLLPEPSRIADASGMMNDVPCLDLEFQANAGNISCMEVQNTWAPVCCPTPSPTAMPSVEPSGSPSFYPSVFPSKKPSTMPSISPSLSPSNLPSMLPTFLPSMIPSLLPTVVPTESMAPANTESVAPSVGPTRGMSPTRTSAAWTVKMNVFMISFTSGVALLFFV